MNRRKLLTLIGLSPLVPFAARAEAGGWGQMPSLTPISDPVPGNVVFAAYAPDKMTFFAATETKTYRLGDGKWHVCENHPDKAWPDECDCGPGMRGEI